MPDPMTTTEQRERVVAAAKDRMSNAGQAGSYVLLPADWLMLSASEVLSLVAALEEAEAQFATSEGVIRDLTMDLSVAKARAETAEQALSTLQQENERLRGVIQEAVDLLLERIHHNPARSAAHNARLTLQAALQADGEAMCSPGGLTVIDAEQWEPCSPAWLAKNPNDCGTAPRVYCAAESNHYHPKDWPGTDLQAPQSQGGAS